MIKLLSKTVLKLSGWKLKVTLPEEKKFVLIGAPHTSNWDFPLAILAFWTFDLKVKWVGKIQLFWGPFYYLFTLLGGIPVDRSGSHGFIGQITNRFDQENEMVLAIAPEGTRSKTEYWKSGFYHIATSAKVPICLAYIDYSTRTLGFSKVLYPSGDIEKDMNVIAGFYKNIKGKWANNQGPVRLRKHS